MEDTRKSERTQLSRELAQVRESITRVNENVDQIQEQNTKRLEEISKLDSEIGTLYSRLAVSEQRLAETFEQKRQAEQLREQQQATDAAKLSDLREALREKEEALKQVEIPEVVCQVEVQTDAKARLSEMRALESKESAQKSLAEMSRQRAKQLREEISRERRRHEELHRALRKAAEDRQTALQNQEALKVAIQKRGADPFAAAGDIEKEAERESEEIRSELASVEEKCQAARNKLKEVKKQNAQEVERLELELRNARGDLERSFRPTDAQREVAEFDTQIMLPLAATVESQLKEEHKKLHIETMTMNGFQERIEQLRQSLSKAKASQSTPRGSPMGNMLTDEIQRTQQQAMTAEREVLERSAELIRLKQQQMDVKVQAEDEARQIKVKIQDIWRSLAISALSG